MHLLKLDRRWNAKHARHRLPEPVPRAPAPPPVPVQQPRAAPVPRQRGEGRAARGAAGGVGARQGAAAGLDPPPVDSYRGQTRPHPGKNPGLKW